jgi:hypothetical protein
MRFLKLLMFSLGVILVGGSQVMAQGRSELALSVGGGSLQVTPGGGGTPVFSFSYQFHITRRISAEGALDVFYYKLPAGPIANQSVYKDDYLGAEAAVVYHFRPNRQTGYWLPFVVAGIGKASTDFTEIAGNPYYRFGAGVSYNMTDRFGFRIEARDELIKSLYQSGNPDGNLPSLCFSIVYRF